MFERLLAIGLIVAAEFVLIFWDDIVTWLNAHISFAGTASGVGQGFSLRLFWHRWRAALGVLASIGSIATAFSVLMNLPRPELIINDIARTNNGDYGFDYYNVGKGTAYDIRVKCMVVPLSVPSLGGLNPGTSAIKFGGMAIAAGTFGHTLFESCDGYQEKATPYSRAVIRVCYSTPWYSFRRGDVADGFVYDPTTQQYGTIQAGTQHDINMFLQATLQWCKTGEIKAVRG
jgi:hypothetical protein